MKKNHARSLNLVWCQPRSVQFIEAQIQVLTYREEKPYTDLNMIWCRPRSVQFIEDHVHVLT